MNNLSFSKRFIRHLITITNHKFLVQKLCFNCGMYKQGIAHDLSKYSIEEFWPSVKYFQGNRSPITYEKELNGYSKCWLHHKGKNKHHWEYWVDRIGTELVPIKMPYNYVLESVLDKIAASKVYKKDDYAESYPYEFFINSKEIHVMNIETAEQIKNFLEYLKDNGEDKTLSYIKSEYKKWKKDKKYMR